MEGRPGPYRARITDTSAPPGRNAYSPLWEERGRRKEEETSRHYEGKGLEVVLVLLRRGTYFKEVMSVRRAEPVTDFYSCGVKFSVALRASSAAESPVIYVLLSESSRFKSEVSGQARCSQGTQGGWSPGVMVVVRLHFLWVFLQTPGCTTPSASDGYEGLMAGWQMLALGTEQAGMSKAHVRRRKGFCGGRRDEAVRGNAVSVDTQEQGSSSEEPGRFPQLCPSPVSRLPASAIKRDRKQEMWRKSEYNMQKKQIDGPAGSSTSIRKDQSGDHRDDRKLGWLEKPVKGDAVGLDSELP
ncbi:hypothetical protein EYF80_008508 [Liparis tanakae]|uniref:Uncharacterized protein n=1 Tax=Liparis tanakae TaxID=230148 RepID=A0A4Z2IUH4_9TELE|nr:hypothetical protein EYF80_008508 [Liparis tanakae]